MGANQRKSFAESILLLGAQFLWLLLLWLPLLPLLQFKHFCLCLVVAELIFSLVFYQTIDICFFSDSDSDALYLCPSASEN